MLDQFLSTIEEVQADGAVVLLKWDGQRVANRYTVVITKSDVDYVWRQDCDDMAQTLQAALTDYKKAQGL
ncbi:hypothetical protein RugamoR64_06320 [Duganella rhizosphaerae]|uniref:hypothetical protein n=1 Tax=Duganella rhizosphaerae TaxID=2885763 RepID=UPI0030E95528